MAFIPSFHTNIVSLDRLLQRNVHWNTEDQQLRFKDVPFGLVERHHGQWVLEYNPTASFVTCSAKPRPIPSATANQWHQRLGHIGPDALEHLPTAVTSTKLDGPTIIEYKVYSISKAHKIISRYPAQRSNTPFERIYLDLI